jgi:hypothetical protein
MSVKWRISFVMLAIPLAGSAQFLLIIALLAEEPLHP